MSEDINLDPHVIMETLFARITKDISDASKYLSVVELTGVLYICLQDVSLQAFQHAPKQPTK